MRWITDKLGTASYGDETIPDHALVLDVRDLIDRGGNSTAAIAEKIQEGVGYLQQDRTVVVCCDYGISRSNSIAAGILAGHEEISLSDAVRRVLSATDETAIKVDTLNNVYMAMDALSPTKPGQDDKGILVTGGNGFIGQALRANAREAHRLIAPDRQSLDLVKDTILLDLLVKEQGVTSIVHLANPRIYTGSDALGVSLTMLKNVLDVCVQNHLRLIWLSSWEIYSGYRSTSLLVDETLSANPAGTYGYSKMLSENLIQQYQNQYDLPVTILRSSPVYGTQSEKPRFIWNFLDKARQGQPITTHRYANGEPALDLLHIDDLISAIQKAIERETSDVFNLGGGELVSTRQVAEWIVKYIGSDSQIDFHQLTRYVGNIQMDSSHAKEKLGWQPQIHWTDGLQMIVQNL